jgi:hypothetical protein
MTSIMYISSFGERKKEGKIQAARGYDEKLRVRFLHHEE